MLEKGSLFLRARLAFHGPAENEPSLWMRGGWWGPVWGGCVSMPEAGTQASAISNSGVETEQIPPGFVSVPLDVLA